MSNKTNNHVRINLDIVTDALESAVNELEATQDELAKVEGELAQAKADLARFDKIREHDFDHLLREYAYNIWCEASYKSEGNDEKRIASEASARTISNIIAVMYNREVCAYKSPNPDHLLIEVYGWVNDDYKPTMYIHWDANSPFSKALNHKVIVK